VKNEISELEQLLAAAGQTSQSTLLLKKRKEMREVDQSLDNMKNQHKQRMDMCEERRIQFESKQAKMREQVLRFEKFIQENDAKRQRAEAKAKQERKLYEDKLKEIAALTDKIKSLEAEQSQLTNLLITNGCYKVYLERIVEEGEFGYGTTRIAFPTIIHFRSP
jgi:TPP-dependent indolepyruvate ferredoxin oxidoreductase alpha subunit